ncbi:hypothetical protein J8I29_24140 [Labrys sp. LIt4]|uniref:hypothetical protein n=1 Tax=Labrys sp. LIt4 TaxID=2821355 RepID=UPI001ADFD92B|nr:hypothetical protein [Labrys sp. LIt4]
MPDLAELKSLTEMAPSLDHHRACPVSGRLYNNLPEIIECMSGMEKPAKTPDLIDSKAVKELVAARALRGATVLGRPGGWGVLVRYGDAERAVAGQKSRRMRLWRHADSAIGFVRSELGMDRFDVDAQDYRPDESERRRPDASERLKRVLSYDEWIGQDLELALRQADDPATGWVDHDDAMAELEGVLAKARAMKAPPRG